MYMYVYAYHATHATTVVTEYSDDDHQPRDYFQTQELS